MNRITAADAKTPAAFLRAKIPGKNHQKGLDKPNTSR
jgi:hypothetical protein